MCKVSKSSLVHFIHSDSFKKNYFKCIVTLANPEDIIKSHEDVYVGINEEPANFDIVESFPIHDRNMFLDFIKKINPQNPDSCLFPKISMDKIVKIIDTANTLHCITQPVNESKFDVEYNFIVKDDFANIYNDTDSSKLYLDSIPTTKVFELYTRDNDTDIIPFYNEFIIFNHGYAYILETFQQVFPEFHVNVHNNFPKYDLAEKMLWFQSEGWIGSNEHGMTLTWMTNIRSFFDRSENIGFNVSTQVPNFGFIDVQNVDIVNNECYVTEVVPTSSLTAFDNLESVNVEVLNRSSNVELFTHPNSFACKNGIVKMVKNDQPSNLQIQGYSNEYPAASFTSTNSVHRSTLTNPINNICIRDNVTNHNVKDETKATTQRHIIMNKFVKEKCKPKKGSKIKSSNLYEIFRTYCEKYHEDSEVKNISQTLFSLTLKQISAFKSVRSKGGMYWIDMEILDSDEITKNKDSSDSHTAKNRPKSPNKSIMAVNNKSNIRISTVVAKDNSLLSFNDFFNQNKDSQL